MPDMRLIVGGKSYSGWNSVRVRMSLDEPINSFELGIVDEWDGSGAPRVRNGSPCEVWLGDQQLISGYLDHTSRTYNGRSRRVSVSGRSRAADLQDCSYPIKHAAQWNKQKAITVIRALCEPFGIEVHDPAGLANQVAALSAVNVGETPMDVIHRYMRVLGAVVVSRPDGGLEITKASTQRIQTPIKLGGNVLSADDSDDLRDRFSEYSVVSQMPGNNNVFGDAAANIVGSSIDAQIKALRYRPTVISPQQSLNLAQSAALAKTTRNQTAGRSHTTRYMVRYWEHASGIWWPNRKVYVDDAECGWDDWLLISSVEFLLDDQGERTHCSVCPASAYDTLALPETTTATGAFN